eukprot:TRINITY_DN2744_c0_g1_i2.p1 TRINITY_DN2744_c0_g1~~TRINITY_DN2744_c0_g1_i2.p1  ORF type:complete len:509 (-),score=55.03 TRINITY_DN2744_c0_g1_i2:102-1565(-)
MTEGKVTEDIEYAELRLPTGVTHRIKILVPTQGEDRFLDIRDLHSKTGHFTYDPGFTCTGSCASAITFIDGPEGRCLYRGYPVADLCENVSYTDVIYLLMYGELPTTVQKATFKEKLEPHMMVNERFKQLLQGLPDRSHPMAVMVTSIGALSAFWPFGDIHDAHDRDLAALRIIAKFPTLAAMAYKTAIGEPPVYPRADLNYAENFLYMMFSTPLKPYEVHPVHAKAIDKFLILHADHEQNASTSTVRIAGSSQANPMACIAAGVACLWGPAHGGANEAVVDMLERIGKVENIPKFIEDVKNKVEGVRLMGFGHRVYKNYDPRAKYMKGLVKEVLETLDVHDDRLEMAMELERVALSDEYFVKRKLYPNVDFYSGIMLRALGIPTSMFTVLFAMARSVGWVCQWEEMISEKQLRIGRPRQVYLGRESRDVKTFLDTQKADEHPMVTEKSSSRKSLVRSKTTELIGTSGTLHTRDKPRPLTCLERSAT